MKQHRKAKDGPFYEANFVLWFCLIRFYVRCCFGLPRCIFTRVPSMCNGPGGGIVGFRTFPCKTSPQEAMQWGFDSHTC